MREKHSFGSRCNENSTTAKPLPRKLGSIPRTKPSKGMRLPGTISVRLTGRRSIRLLRGLGALLCRVALPPPRIFCVQRCRDEGILGNAFLHLSNQGDEEIGVAADFFAGFDGAFGKGVGAFPRLLHAVEARVGQLAVFEVGVNRFAHGFGVAGFV